MIMLVGPLLLLLLGLAAVALKKRGLSGGEVVLFVIVGIVCIGAVMFGILAWGFSGFG
jgi:hypothetical protein